VTYNKCSLYPITQKFKAKSKSPRPKIVEDIQRFFLPIFKDFSKTFESNQLSKNCECKHHFFPVISPATSHLKMYLFVDIWKTLLFNQSILLARKSYNQVLTKELILKTFFAFSHNSKTFQRPTTF
jgi:hypothetical protein